MPRPSRPDKRREKTEANRMVKHRLWDEQAAREARHDALVQRLIDKALSKKRSQTFNLDEALAEFDEAREMALALKEPLAAAKCTWFKSQLAGLVVDRQAVLHAHTSNGDSFNMHGSTEEIRQRLIDRLAEKHGSARAQRLISAIERELDDGEVSDEQ
jgi:hypothetical protein